jgi:hypothetical protein
MEGFYIIAGGAILTAIVFAIYFIIQDRKEEKKRKAH